MNLPEYRRACRMAQERFQVAISAAGDILAKDLMAADEQFFEDQEKAAEREDYAIEKRR